MARKNTGENDLLPKAQKRLYSKLDARYRNCFGRDQIWLKLVSLDKGLVNGSMRMEPFDPEAISDSKSRDRALEKFTAGEPTLVFGMQHKEQAAQAAHLLGRLLVGCEARFHSEPAPKGGYQVRCTLDKQIWDKLTVLCQYRFEREVLRDPNHAGGKDYYDPIAQRRITSYTKDTDNADWKTLSGVPAFITLMGLPGLLRPQKREKLNISRKQREFSDPSPLGTPQLFKGIPVHVELKSSKNDGTFDAYSFGYDPNLDALNRALGGRNFLSFTLETLGGDPFFERRIKADERLRKLLGLGTGIVGLVTISDRALDLFGGLGLPIGAGAAAIGAYTDYRWEWVNRFASAIARTKSYSVVIGLFRRKDGTFEAVQVPPERVEEVLAQAERVAQSPHAQDVGSPKIGVCSPHTGGVEVEKEPMSSKPCNQIHVLELVPVRVAATSENHLA